MRLIDAEEFKDDIFRQIELIKVNDFEVLPVVDVNECLNNAPTVEAIPIEWIYRWRLKNMDKCPVDFIPFSDLLNDWEKENERP